MTPEESDSLKDFSITLNIGGAKFHLIRYFLSENGDWSFGIVWLEMSLFNHWNLFYVDKLLGDRRFVLLNHEWTFSNAT